MNVGVTGHQSLPNPQWVALAIETELQSFSGPLTVISSLATGADQLVSSIALRQGGRLHAVIPFAGYESTFAQEHLATYRALLSAASIVDILPRRETNEDSYLAAGQRVVDLSSVVLAVWDGLPARGKGGTADIVAYARGKALSIIHIDPIRQTVYR